MNEKMAKVRIATWEHMRQNYPELWEQYGKYTSLPEQEFGEIIFYRAQAHYHVDLGMDEIERILKEVYNAKLNGV